MFAAIEDQTQPIRTERNTDRVKNVVRLRYKYTDFDEDLQVYHPPGLECYKIDRSHATIYIPRHIADHWSTDLMENLENQSQDEDDVLLVTAGKTGTHWTWEIISMLLRQEAAYLSESKHSSWLEFVPYQTIVTNSCSQRILNTHLKLSDLPPGFRNPYAKIIACLRNPKDVFVSYFHHAKIICPQATGMTFSEFIYFCLHSKQFPFGNILDHYADIWDNFRHDPNVLIIFYEDLKEYTYNTVELIAKHLRIPCASKLITDISAAVDINRMRSGKYTSEARLRERFGKNATLYRKGEIGDWRNYFTVALNEQFELVFNEWNKDRNIPFRFEPSVVK